MIRDEMKRRILVFDGAMGTMLQNAGLKTGSLPEVYNITHPEIVENIHREYIKSGADIITANTFQANRLKLKGSGYTVEEIIKSGTLIAKSAGAKYTALDIGPLGQLMEPMGTMTFDKAYEIYREQVVYGEKYGADIILFETMSDLLEVKAAALAAKENTSLPVFVTMTFQDDGRTFVGCDPVSCAVTLSGLGVDALGVNCSLGPNELLETVEKLIKYSRVPVMVQPNAGLPRIENGNTVYDITPEEYCAAVKKMIDMGVRIAGGCCGTNPEFIKKLSDTVKGIEVKEIKPLNVSAVCSGTQTVILDNKLSVIGERINPTGKKVLKERLRQQDFAYIIGEAISQTDRGADILDVNTGLPEIDEVKTLTRAVKEIQAVTSVPLQIDSSDAKAIESAARIYNGKPIINSVNGKQESMDAVFPIVKKYGAAVVALLLDENGIPKTAKERLEVALKIVKEANGYGIRNEDILIDCLVLTASAQQDIVIETINAIKLVKANIYGVKTVLGVSNVSFGLPRREILNSVFLAAASGAGLDAAIINPLSEEMMKAVYAFRVLNNQDKDAKAYIDKFSQTADSGADNRSMGADKKERSLKELIIEGRKEEAAEKTKELLKEMDGLKIIDEHFVPALDAVGERYEKGTIFLPQLMQSAEAVKNGFNVLKEFMDKKGEKTQSKGEIILATVKGDIHDIGKNIAKMLLENYGYNVIDLGKDVPIETIVDEAVKRNIKLIGLSALMTTTVKSMKDTITALRATGKEFKIMVGGAVLNEEYVEFVGADYFVPDARADIKIASEIFSRDS